MAKTKLEKNRNNQRNNKKRKLVLKPKKKKQPPPQNPNPKPNPSLSDSDDDDEAPLSSPDRLYCLLEPHSKDQLISLLLDAVASDPGILARIKAAADRDVSHRKLFVHGLGWDATRDQLLAAFSPFGLVEDCNVVTDKVTGRSKGYGFVLFKTRAGAQKALKNPQKKIGNRVASCQLASVGPVPGPGGGDAVGRKAAAGPALAAVGPVGGGSSAPALLGAAPQPMLSAATVQSLALLGQNPTAYSALLAQNPLLAAALNPAAFAALNPSVGLVQPYAGAATGLGGNASAPSLLGAYGAQGTMGLQGLQSYGAQGSAGLQGLQSYGTQGPTGLQGLQSYQGSQIGQLQSSAAAGLRPGGSLGGFPSYFR